MSLLEVSNLKKYYDSQRAVDGISFSVEPGSVFGLLGPNGAGKTTLIRMITGIFYPDEGEIRLNGQPFGPSSPPGLTGYMPEERGLYKKMKIGEQAVYLARLKGLSKQEASERVRHWFAKLGMLSWWNRKAEDLSKGMGQKLQFVVTVLHEPALVVLDEPFSGLDPVNANMIRDEIFELAKRGRSVIFSTHRMEQVEEICDHIVLINTGKKILDGTIRDIKQQFKENLFAIHLDERAAYEMPEAFDIISSPPGKLVVKIRDGYRPNDILRYFLDREINIRGFNEILPSMNDIFIKLVDGTSPSRQFQNQTQESNE